MGLHNGRVGVGGGEGESNLTPTNIGGGTRFGHAKGVGRGGKNVLGLF